MSRKPGSEPFPQLSPHHLVMTSENNSNSDAERPIHRRRRKSSGLPGEPRGDTGAAALSTITDQSSPVSLRGPTDKHISRGTRGYKRRKAKTFLRRWRSLTVRHTWINPLTIVVIILAAYFVNPGEHNPLHRAIVISYPIPSSSPPGSGKPVQYGKGMNDFAFVAFYTIVLSFTREFLMQRVIRPLALRWGIRSRSKQSRFMEQAYTAIYFSVLGPLGVYVMYRSPVWYFNTRGMYEGFPHQNHEGLFKAYYLVQAAYWSQQAMVLLLQLEAPRKDFKELVFHHFVTIALIWCSYRFHFGFMGLPVFITHDVSDFFLATSKTFNYLDSEWTQSFFVLFAFVWAYGRHYLNLCILYSVLTEFKTVGPFELNWETQQYKGWIAQYITFTLLTALQAVNMFWFFLILRIAKRITLDSKIIDERSEGGSVDGDQGSTANSTEEKRRAMGINGDPQAGVGAQEDVSTPTVLLNGVPVDESDQNKSGPLSVKSSGRKSVEITAQQRRKVGR